MISFLVCLALAGPGDLDELARRLDLQWTADAATGRHTVRAGRNLVVFVPGLSTALVNGAAVHLPQPVIVEAGRVKLPVELSRHVESAPARGSTPKPAEIVQGPVREPRMPEVKPARRIPPVTVAIDPGHGGMHTGGKGRTGLMEKDIVLDVSLHLRDILEEWGARVVMTRADDRHFDKDVDDDLNARVAIVNAARADVFISVHANYVGNPIPRGFEVWVPLAGGSRGVQSRQLAEIMLNRLGEVWSSENRGIKDEHNLRVLKGTTSPACLVELEFVSHPRAERELAQPAVRRRLAETLAEGVRQFVSRRP